MIKLKPQQKTELVSEDVICDICKKSCAVYPYGDDTKHFVYMTLEANWGYASNKDTTWYKAQVCEKCVDEKLSPLIQFQIGSIVTVY